MQELATIKSIFIYPIKSCAGISVESALVTKLGLASLENNKVYDRYAFNLGFHFLKGYKIKNIFKKMDENR